MIDRSLLGPWLRRFLLEHLVAERNLSLNTQVSYREHPSQLPGYNDPAAAVRQRSWW